MNNVVQDYIDQKYQYDALGRGIEKQKQHSQAGRNHYTETTQYGWDGDTLAYESTNLYTKHYVYENGSFVPLIQATYRQQINQHQTPSWENDYDYDKDPLWHTKQKANAFDRVWFYHCDHLGTPQEMSDQTGAIVWSANYKAWGECKTENHTKRDIWDSEIITNNLRFQGQYYDDETGLHYNRYRYYSLYVGRFISKDPIKLLGGLNDYNYTLNPVEWIDPLGLKDSRNSKILGRNITGKDSWTGQQAHHLIPEEIYDNNTVFFSKINFKLNGLGNGIMLPEVPNQYISSHKGYHKWYSQAVGDEISFIQGKYKCAKQQAIAVERLQRNLDRALRLGKLPLYGKINKTNTGLKKSDWSRYIKSSRNY